MAPSDARPQIAMPTIAPALKPTTYGSGSTPIPRRNVGYQNEIA